MEVMRMRWNQFFDGDDESNAYFVEKSPASWKVRGHGTYEEIDGEDAARAFFQLAKDHERLVIHFYRTGSSACDIMHTHLDTIAKQHLRDQVCQVKHGEKIGILDEKGVFIIFRDEARSRNYANCGPY
jgi:hypothetical protein